MEEKTPHPHDGMDYLMPGEEDDYEDEVIESKDDLMRIDVDVDKMKELLLKKTKEDLRKKGLSWWHPQHKYADRKDWQQQQHHLDNYLRGSTRKNFYPYSNSGPNA